MTKKRKPSNSLETTDFFSSTSESFQGSYSLDVDFHERRALWSKIISKYGESGQSALDLGCGPGILTRELLHAGLAVTAVDGSVEMIKLCKKNSADLGKGDPELIHDYLPALSKLGKRTFDLLLCSSVLEYVAELRPALARISGLVCPGGYAIISMPNRESLFRKYETAKFRFTGKPEYRAHVKNLLSKEEFSSIAEQADLALLETSYYGDGTGLVSRLSRGLPAAKRKNLFLSVFRKK